MSEQSLLASRGNLNPNQEQPPHSQSFQQLTSVEVLTVQEEVHAADRGLTCLTGRSGESRSV